MCTAINFLNQQHENVFGRTMDFHYILDPRLAVFPAGSTWENTLGRQLTDRYAVAGISRHFKNLYVLFDGVNEKGLAGGALYFKGYADFPPFSQQSGKAQVPAWTFCTMSSASAPLWTTSGSFWPTSPWWGFRTN